MTSVISIGTALPSNTYSFQDMNEIGTQWLAKRPDELELYKRFLNSSKAENRNFAIPAAEILKLNGMEHRCKLFEIHGPELGEQAVLQALKEGELATTQIDSMIFTSCSCPSIPAIDSLIIERVGMSPETARIPIYQHGCAGGVVGLQLASKLTENKNIVALTSVELCSLVFQGNSESVAQLVGSAIFADGAACALIGPDKHGMVIKGSQSYLVPGSRHLMGYDILDDGVHLRLDRDLPRALSRVAAERINGFLSQHGSSPDGISFWLFHPGGIRILEFLESIFSLKPEQCRWSREILQNTGNLSSATILYVLKDFIDSKEYRPGDKILMTGIGPGLTLELILFEYIE